MSYYDYYDSFYKNLEILNDQEAELLFPGAVEAAAPVHGHGGHKHIFGVKDNSLYMFVREFPFGDLNGDYSKGDQVKDVNWMLCGWQNGDWKEL